MNLNLAVLNFETREELWTLKGVEDFYLSSGSGHHSQYFRAGWGSGIYVVELIYRLGKLLVGNDWKDTKFTNNVRCSEVGE